MRGLFLLSVLFLHRARAAETLPPLGEARLNEARVELAKLLETAARKPHQRQYLQVQMDPATVVPRRGFRTSLSERHSLHFAEALRSQAPQNFATFFIAAESTRISAKRFYEGEGRRFADYYERRYGERVGDDLGLGFAPSRGLFQDEGGLLFANDLTLNFTPPAGENTLRILRVLLKDSHKHFQNIWTDFLVYPWILLLGNLRSMEDEIHIHELRHYFDFRRFRDLSAAGDWIDGVNLDLLPLSAQWSRHELARILDKARVDRTDPRIRKAWPTLLGTAYKKWGALWIYLLRPVEVRAYQETAIFLKEQGETWEEVIEDHPWPTFSINLSEIGVSAPPFRPAFFDAYLKRAYDTEQLDPLEVGATCERVLAPHLENL